MVASLSMRVIQYLKLAISLLMVMIVMSCGSRIGGGQKSRLPTPLSLPADPSAVVHLSHPQRLWAELDRWVPGFMSTREFVREAMILRTSSDSAQAIAMSVDDGKAWSMIRLDGGQEIWNFSLSPGGEQQMQSYMANMPPEGKFGAVRLPNAAPFDVAQPNTRAKVRPALAWIDKQSHTLTIAPNLRALISGKEIKRVYGRNQIHIEAEIASIPEFIRKLIPAEFPLASISAQGRMESMKVEVQFIENSADPMAQFELENGALTGLLSDPSTVVAATSRWREHKRATDKILKQVDREVRRLPFFVKGTAESLAVKLKKLLETWDGKVAVGLGPAGHIRIAFGTDQIERSEKTALSLAKSTAETLSTARTFISDIPNFKLRPNIDKVSGIPVHRFTLYRARSYVPREFSALLTSDNKLRAAMAWSPRAEALMVVIGPQSTREIKRWLSDHLQAPSSSDTNKDLAAAVLSVEPNSVYRLLPNWKPDDIFDLRASAARRQLVLRRLASHRYDFRYTVVGSSQDTASPITVRSRSTSRRNIRTPPSSFSGTKR